MARIRQDQPLVPSILDRLIDEDPMNRRELPKDHHQVLREMKRSVQRDLENLLNTRSRVSPYPEDLTELETSLVNYGIPDFTGVNMGSPEARERLRVIIEDAIRRYEPRFLSVRVHLVKSQDPADRQLRLRIDAMLQAEPAPEPVVFDSQREPTCGTFEVKSIAT